MITYKSASTPQELQQILDLQRANLPQSISSEEKSKEGFVTVNHEMSILSEMNNVCGHIIAKDDDKVVAYALCMHPQFGNEIEVLKPMFSEINKTKFRKESYIVMGQICIDKTYRKRGIFRKLYETMQRAIAPEFSIIITEVDLTNLRSLEAHYAVGFKLLKQYRSGGQNWALIYLV